MLWQLIPITRPEGEGDADQHEVVDSGGHEVAERQHDDRDVHAGSNKRKPHGADQAATEDGEDGAHVGAKHGRDADLACRVVTQIDGQEVEACVIEEVEQGDHVAVVSNETQHAGANDGSDDLTSQLPFEPKGDELRPAGSILAYPMLHGDLSTYFERMKDVPGNIATQAPLIAQALYGTTEPTAERVAELDLFRYIGVHVPPLFLWHSIDDPVVNPADTTRFVCALQEAGVPCEYHLYSNGGHGLACANRHYAKNDAEVSDKIATWVPMAATWMCEIAEAR